MRLFLQQKEENMEQYFPILRNTQLFAGLSDREMTEILHCLQARRAGFERGAYVLRQGEQAGSILLLVEGSLHIQSDDYWGNRSIVNTVRAGELFGAAYAAPGGGPLLNDVVAVEKSTVLFFEIGRLFSVCPSGCRFHGAVVQNLFFVLAEKNRELTQKLVHMAQRSTREKLVSYLSCEAKRRGSPDFSIPFNRQQLADYLSVDRSALSRELCRMREEGMLSFEKNHFILR